MRLGETTGTYEPVWAERHARECRHADRILSSWMCRECGASADYTDYHGTVESLHVWWGRHYHDCAVMRKRRAGSVVMR